MSNRLFIGNLAWDADADVLRSAVEDRGFVVTDVYIPLDRESGRPRGFAFLELESSAAADEAAEVLEGTVVGGRPVRVDRARART